MEIIDSLLSIEKQLTLWIFSTVPGSEDEERAMTRVLALRDDLLKTINDLVLHRMKIATLGLADEAAALATLNERIKGTAKAIQTAQEMIHTATEVLAIAASVAAAVA